ncbi:PREDICTED: uncharacterized protein LOC104819200 [Tarenaya hassleriana]|uniref:uncharacterized protein LOC104819200 n=1 Tax=Tarenaya hassleriana TaxID=28532 RepID=UPI00053C8EA7|nr:PREDICTED: uncharacterized protein LOC104819200 [Tarenaya hassleriana]
MDSSCFDSVKAEKAKALWRYHGLRSIGRVFRAAEVCVALLFLSWTFTRLPFAVQISGEFIRRLAGVVSSPLFMFLLGNSIVVALLAKSSDRSSGADTEFYEALVRSGEHRSRPSLVNQTEEEIVYDDKQVIVTEPKSYSNSNSHARGEHAMSDDAETDSDSETDDLASDHPKIYRRSKSDISVKQSPEKVTKCSLRRSETEKYRRTEEVEGDDRVYPEDKLSNEEFQKTIEAFIAKQLMFRRRESLAVVLHKPGLSSISDERK